MHEIRPIGSFFPLDTEGYIINPCKSPPFDPFWENMFEQIRTYLVQYFPEKLHSIWLRGSVAQGKAVAGQSDLDIFALFKTPGLHWQELPGLHKLREQIGEKDSFPLECQLESYNGNPQELRSQIAMLTATQSVCLWGEDLRPQLKKYKPGKEVMLEYRWIAADVEDWLLKIQQGERLEKEAFCSFMKTIIRAGFELVMERDGRYTRDLYPAYQVFSAYYPKKEPDMKQALLWYLNPIPDRALLQAYLQDFGRWLGRAF